MKSENSRLSSGESGEISAVCETRRAPRWVVVHFWKLLIILISTFKAFYLPSRVKNEKHTLRTCALFSPVLLNFWFMDSFCPTHTLSPGQIYIKTNICVGRLSLPTTRRFIMFANIVYRVSGSSGRLFGTLALCLQCCSKIAFTIAHQCPPRLVKACRKVLSATNNVFANITKFAAAEQRRPFVVGILRRKHCWLLKSN